MSAFLNARGAPPPLALAPRLRAALGPQALLTARGAPPPLALAPRLRAALGPQALLTARPGLLSLALLVLLPSHGIAEYKRVELKILGMDCAICAHGVRVAVQKVAGVESVELSLERAQADIRLIKDNRVSLDQFRKIVKGNGFEPKQATVTAIGTVREVDGKLAFEVSGVPRPLLVSPDKSATAAHAQLKKALEAKSPASFEITGVVETPGDGVEWIAIASVK